MASPEAMIAFLESDDYESAVRLVISLGAMLTRLRASLDRLRRRFGLEEMWFDDSGGGEFG